MTGEEFFGWGDGHQNRAVDVDKAWHAIHAVPTGTAWEVGSPISTVFLEAATENDGIVVVCT